MTIALDIPPEIEAQVRQVAAEQGKHLEAYLLDLIWVEHFRWNDDFIHLIGLSPTGRATIAKLHLNREVSAGYCC